MKSLSTALLLISSFLVSGLVSAQTHWLNVIGMYDKGENPVMSLPTMNAQSCQQAINAYVRNEHVVAISCDVRPLGK